MSDKPRVAIEEDRIFARTPARDLVCDIFTPPDPEPRAPGVLLVHGGGWSRGDKSQTRMYGIRLALEGFVCVSATYRLTPEAPWPAQIHDVKTAIRWMRDQADALGIDRARIGAVGLSAGAHLVLLAAGTPTLAALDPEPGGVPTDLSAVVGVFAPTLISPGRKVVRGGTPAAALLPDPQDAEAARLASPITHVTGDFPPTFLIHGSADRIVPIAASTQLYERLVEAGVPTEVHLYPDQPHAFVAQRDFHRLSCHEIGLFLKRYMGVRPHVDLPRQTAREVGGAIG